MPRAAWTFITERRRSPWPAHRVPVPGRDENGRKTSQPFSTSTFEYENENESSKAGHENEHELTEYQKFRKRTNSSGILSNTIGIRKINTEY